MYKSLNQKFSQSSLSQQDTQSKAGADPDQFPPFYGNRSDFHIKYIK